MTDDADADSSEVRPARGTPDDSFDEPLPETFPDVPPVHIGRAKLTLVVAPVAILWLANVVQWFSQAVFLDNNPMLLMALGPSNRNVVFTADAVQDGRYPFWLFFLVGFVRLLAPDASFYILGHLYGQRAIRWMERRTSSLGASMRGLERAFGRWGPALVVIMPNNPVCLLAGAARMRVSLFVTLNVIGTAGRMFVLYWVGDALSSPIDWFLEVLKENRPWFIALSVVSGIILFFTEFRKGTTEVQQLQKLEDEVEPEEELA